MPLPELVESEKLFKSAAWDTMRDLALGSLFAAVPMLDWWPVNAIVRWVIEKYTDELFVFFTELVNLAYVVLKNKSLQKMFTEFALELKGIAVEKGINSIEYKGARLAHQQSFAKKVRSLLVPSAA